MVCHNRLSMFNVYSDNGLDIGVIQIGSALNEML